MLLAALPARERDRIRTLGEVVHVAAGALLHGSGERIEDVWFPVDAVASLGQTMESGAGTDVALIGPEGVVGATALLAEIDVASHVSAVQVGGAIYRVPLHALRQESARSAALRRLLQRYAQALFVQSSQAAACSRFHTVEQRLSRSLLALHDRVPGDEIRITHDRLAAMLGSFRPAVTVAARHLQDTGIIDYSRGRITVIDRARLLDVACECYDVVTSEYGRLLDPRRIRAAAPDDEPSDETLREMNSRLLIAALREQQAREEAEHATELATRFFAMVSHEMRAPLTAILGWAEMLASGQLDDDTLHLAIDTIRRNADAQRRLVDDILDLTRLRAGRMALQFEPVDVAEAVRQAVASSRPAADAAGVAISVISGAPAIARADPARLQQILLNLLSNAVKFTPSAGAIEVTVTLLDACVEIRVRDRGRGIGPELLPHIFDAFRQGDAPPRGELGMGLGLTIVRELVAFLGGTVGVESSDDGATFTIRLPRHTTPSS